MTSPISTESTKGVAEAANDGLELIGGAGTPNSDDPILKDVPTPDGPIAGYTPVTSSYDSNGDGFLTGPDIILALQTEYPRYEWPSRYQLDLDAVIEDIEEEVEKYNTQYENGMEYSLLDRHVFCAWKLELRDAIYAGDETLIAEDIERLRTILASNPTFDGVRPYEEDAINKAELGDPGPLQQMIEGGFCEGLPWIASPDSDPSTGRIDVLAIRNENFDEMV